MGLNFLEVLYNSLLGLGIMMDEDVLKYDGQYPKSIHTLAIFIMLLRHDKFLIISLRCLQDSPLGSEVKSLLHLQMDNKNSSFEKGNHSVGKLFEISSNNKTSIC